MKTAATPSAKPHRLSERALWLRLAAAVFGWLSGLMLATADLDRSPWYSLPLGLVLFLFSSREMYRDYEILKRREQEAKAESGMESGMESKTKSK
jgi:hypothetical protein